MSRLMYKPEDDQPLSRNRPPEPYTLAEKLKLPQEVTVGIKGLTDRHAEFNRIGELRKGDVKSPNGIGKDLGQFFRFTCDDPDTVKRFQEAYGTTPFRLEFYLPHPSWQENFDAWMEEWKAGGLVHRCDGENCLLWLGSDGKYHTDPRPCPGNCKQVGRLKIILPALERLAYVTVLTTSKHDILRLSAQLRAYEQLRGDLRGVPFILCRRQVKISTPGKDGRVRREKWLLSIEPQQQWVALQIEATRQAAIPQLTAPGNGAVDHTVNAPTDAAPDEEDFSEGEYEEADNGHTEQPAVAKANGATPPAAPRDNGNKTPDKSQRKTLDIGQLREFIDRRVHTYLEQWGNDELCSDKQRGLLVSKLEEIWAGNPDAAKYRHDVLKFLVNVASIKVLNKAQASALLDWLLDGQDPDTHDYLINHAASQEAQAIVREALEAAGQQSLPLS